MTKILRIVFLALIGLCFTIEGAQPITPCGINRSDKRSGYVAACMMFQNEGRYLKEWLEYHKNIGIAHFYLYNNASTDNFWEILMPYVMNGQVELFDLFEKTANVDEHNDLQRQVYNHAVNLANGRNEWLAIIDSDEFICMPHQKNLAKFLTSYLDAPGLVVNWVMYGSSGVDKLSPLDLQIDRFVYRAPDDWGEHFLYKSIVRPQYVVHADIHICEYPPGLAAVYANHQRFSHTPVFSSPPIDEIRINHYWWRDEQYFQEVKRPRRSGWLSGYSETEIDSRRQIYNSVFDPSMSPWVNKTRKKIFRKYSKQSE